VNAGVRQQSAMICKTMNYAVTILISWLLMSGLPVLAQANKSSAINRNQLLKKLRECGRPAPRECNEDLVQVAAERYRRGDKSMLQELMNIAPNNAMCKLKG
jgi:hypothetical protein